MPVGPINLSSLLLFSVIILIRLTMPVTLPMLYSLEAQCEREPDITEGKELVTSLRRWRCAACHFCHQQIATCQEVVLYKLICRKLLLLFYVDMFFD